MKKTGCLLLSIGYLWLTKYICCSDSIILSVIWAILMFDIIFTNYYNSAISFQKRARIDEEYIGRSFFDYIFHMGIYFLVYSFSNVLAGQTLVFKTLAIFVIVSKMMQMSGMLYRIRKNKWAIHS